MRLRRHGRGAPVPGRARELTACVDPTVGRPSTSTTIARVFRAESGRAVATPGPRLRRHRPRRGRRSRRRSSIAARALARHRACRPARAAGSSPPPATGRIDRLRRESTRDDRHAQAVACCTADDEPEEVGPGGRRPAPAHLHLLPPGARPRRAGGADPAPARRAADPRDRPRLPRARGRRWPSGSCGPSARSAPPTSPTGSRRDAELPDRLPAGARRRLPRLQRGLRRVGRRRPGPGRPVRRGHPPRPGCSSSSCPTSPRPSACWR